MVYAWDRHWARPGATVATVGGYVAESEADGVAWNPEVVPFHHLRGAPGLALLGEMGAGKTHAIRAIVEEERSATAPQSCVHFQDLALHTTDVGLRSAISDSTEVREWLAGTGELYLRGNVVAMLVDAEIRRISGGARSLDDLMKELLSARPVTIPTVTPDTILAKIAAFTSPVFAERIRRIVVLGAPAGLDPAMLEPCLHGHMAKAGPLPPEGKPTLVPTFALDEHLPAACTQML